MYMLDIYTKDHELFEENADKYGFSLMIDNLELNKIIISPDEMVVVGYYADETGTVKKIVYL